MPSDVNAEVSPLGHDSEQEKKSDSDVALQDDETKRGMKPYFVSVYDGDYSSNLAQ